MTMSLSDWQKNGWLKAHRPTRQEIVDLLGLAERDLKIAKLKELDDDWRFNIAYNAALQTATAALVACGYAVPKGDSHHFRVIGSLAFDGSSGTDESGEVIPKCVGSSNMPTSTWAWHPSSR